MDAVVAVNIKKIMTKKRASSTEGQNASKRLCTEKNNAESSSASDVSEMSDESDGENNCSQNPDFVPQEHNVSSKLL